MFEDGQHDRNL